MNNENDHDLLIALKAEVTTKLDRVIADVRELKDNVAARVTALEEEKANQKDLEGLGIRISKLERLVYTGLGALGLLEFLLQIYTNYFHKA